MRTLIRARARTLAAGAGVLLACGLAGCWSTPKEPPPQSRGPSPMQNIPKTGVSSGLSVNNSGGGYPRLVAGQAGAANTGGANLANAAGGGQPLGRVSGAPADPSGRVNLTSAAMGSAAGGAVQLGGQPGFGGVNAVRPVPTRPGVPPGVDPAILPAGHTAGALPELDPVPSAQRDLPPVNSYQDMYQNRTWQKKSPPEMPADNGGLPMPNALPKLRSVEPLNSGDTLPPPPK